MASTMDSREFLTACLKDALEDADLVDAIAEQAIMQGLNAVAIGKGIVSAEALKDSCFLTQEEATRVIDICSARTGTKAAPASAPGLITLRLLALSSGSIRLSIKERSAIAAPEPAPVAAEPEPVVVAHQPEPVPSEAQEEVTPPVPVEGPAEEPALVQMMHEAPGVVLVSRTSPAAKKAAPGPPSPLRPASAPAPKASPASKPSPVAKASPAGRPKSAAARPSELVLPDSLAPPAASTSPTSTSHSVPSYLRPTAAHKARTSKEVESMAALASPGGALAPVPEEQSRRQQRRRNLFSRMASTLLAPTQAFVARVTGRSEDVKAKKDVPITKASLQLEAVMCSPQGQRVTRPQPFMLRSELRPKSCVLSKEELDLMEAKEKAFRRNPVPKHVHEQRSIDPAPKTTPKKPTDIFAPFQLASLELHNKKMEELKKKKEEEAAREDEARRFKARQFDSRLSAGAITPKKPEASPVTKGSAPVFASEARIAHYHAVVEPAKRAREEEANKEKLEAERRARELEDMSVDDFRKTLEFKARAMPDFSSPFKPDPALAKPVTSAAEPELHTVKRLGTAPIPGRRSNKDGDGLGTGVYDGAGYVDPFFASLRKSTSVALNPRSSQAASMRRSVNVRQSAQAALGGGGANGGGLRVSVGSALQAAIRAAARDAARDLSARDAATPSKSGCSTERGAMERMASPAVAAV
ncbi:hypothetical protein HYH03_019097 [Edaphochlamys debaryana]|uniref:TPX2 C-terminal domain-containing protein n=1 Tax=Edaphochlamys debaryana TaxID=47281 RepID=A0A835XFQ8_9CHLO|nr:hypothetical protein HYH03_019097 [Edaphochlamys debaryana]|eukprot:KAG2481943.1 hypothetical protein HYH03_019097 [Edaphochlamys debaryana]